MLQLGRGLILQNEWNLYSTKCVEHSDEHTTHTHTHKHTHTHIRNVRALRACIACVQSYRIPFDLCFITWPSTHCQTTLLPRCSRWLKILAKWLLAFLKFASLASFSNAYLAPLAHSVESCRRPEKTEGTLMSSLWVRLLVGEAVRGEWGTDREWAGVKECMK